MITTADYFRSLPMLQTARLRLRPLTAGNAEALFAYASSPPVAQYTSWPTHRTIDASRNFIRDLLENANRGEPNAFAIVRRSTNQLIGTCGFAAFESEHRCAELDTRLASLTGTSGTPPKLA